MGYPWGLDFGNQNCVVAIARKGGIDVIDNEASSRKTPCMVGLGGTQRGLGEGGKSRITSNITNTVTDLKRLIGRRWAEEEIQRDMEMYPFKMKQAPDGGILIELSYQKDGGECVPTNYTPEQLLGMLFVNLKHTAEEHNKSPSKDCVISVPCFFNDAQRRAVKNAASIAGLNVLRLMNETAAAALHWGLPKTMDLPEDSAAPKHVLFYDMGHSSTQVCVVAYHKNNMTVLASAFDRSLGGRDFDMCMMKHFAVQWKDKTKLDLLSNPKAAYRLSVAVDKVKQQLSGYNSYAKLPVNVECLQEDHDFHSFIDTDEWIAMTKELCEKALDPVKAAIKDSKLNFDQIEEIEVIGSATRSPLITNAIRDFIGKEPKRTMNSEEAVSKGCALMAAMISPNFRVRDFQVRDSTPYPIHLSWGASAGGDAMEVDDGAATTSKGGVVFTQHNIFPSVKMLTFMRSHPFEIAATYANPTDLAPGMEPKIANFLVNNVVSAVDGGPSKVKVKVRIDIHGLLSVDSAQIVEEVEVEEPAKKEGDTPMTDSDKTPEAPSDADAGAQPAEPKPEEADEKKEEPKEKEKKKNLKKSDLPVVTNPWFEVPENKIKDFIQIEYEMSVQDRMIKELQEKKNDLEAYIYSMRERCGESGDLANFISQADREKFMSLMDIMENWLYEDEAEHANKSTFVAKLDELRVFGAPAVEKAKEAEERPLAVKSLQDAIAEYSAFVSSTDPIYEHIGSEDRAKVQEKVDAASQWLNQKLQEQASRSPTDALAVLSTDIKQKKVSLQYECRPIMTKPKPAPPKEEKKEEKKDEESKPAAGAAEGAEVPPPTPAEPMEEAMD